MMTGNFDYWGLPNVARTAVRYRLGALPVTRLKALLIPVLWRN